MIRKVVCGRKLLFETLKQKSFLYDSLDACGGSIWPASDLIVQYFTDNPSYLKGKNVLELGAGCGIVGISLASMKHCKSMTLTDRIIKQGRMTYNSEGILEDASISSPMLLELMKKNIELNRELLPKLPSVAELEWGREHEACLEKLSNKSNFDLIIGSDLTYLTRHADPLFWTVSKVLKTVNDSRSNSEAMFVTAHQHRLDASTDEIVKIATKSHNLQHFELLRSDVYSIWMFKL